MKQLLNIGTMVDDGSGDYLRRGGQKINNNFEEIYKELGDTVTPFAAGAWKTWSFTNGPILKPAFGNAFAVNTTSGRITINLPKGSPAKYNHVVKIRDIWGTWQKNPITVVPASGDTMKGSSAAKRFSNNLQDLEFVYCSPGRWEYVENKYVDRITNSDLSTMNKRRFIATEGQTDFLDIFNGQEYNISNTDLFLRGNLLYIGYKSDGSYDPTVSDWGSPGPIPGSLVAPNGKDIRIKWSLKAGDTLQVVTYFDGIGTWRSSYNRETIKFLDSNISNAITIPGTQWAGDLSTKKYITPDDLGLVPGVDINPYALEIILNGRTLVESGDAGIPEFACSGAFGPTEQECIANSGIWAETNSDYSLVFAPNSDKIERILFPKGFDHNDILVVRWYNNNIGTTMGIEEITAVTNKMYLNVEEPLNLINRIEYTDYNNPTQKNMRPVADEFNITVTTMRGMFDLLYPIGTLYENAHNPANPVDYMGMGIWERYAEGKVVAGWDSDVTNSKYALNNNDLDINGNPSHTAGGTFGTDTVQLKTSNIPVLQSSEKVLIEDDKGTIVVGGCQFDPDSQGPGYTKYREDILKVNVDVVDPIPVNIVQPTVTAYKWIRVG